MKRDIVYTKPNKILVLLLINEPSWGERESVCVCVCWKINFTNPYSGALNF